MSDSPFFPLLTFVDIDRCKALLRSGLLRLVNVRSRNMLSQPNCQRAARAADCIQRCVLQPACRLRGQQCCEYCLRSSLRACSACFGSRPLQFGTTLHQLFECQCEWAARPAFRPLACWGVSWAPVWKPPRQPPVEPAFTLYLNSFVRDRFRIR